MCEVQNADLRVFTLSSKSESELEQDRTNMETLLAKFRIKCSLLTIIPHDTRKPQPEM